jgi:sulfoxide reductase catalytic subunit YedY
MLIRVRPRWSLPESLVTPEAVFFNRRSFLALSALALAGCRAEATPEPDPSEKLYPFPANPAYKDAGRPVTALADNLSHNNYYEFGTADDVTSESAVLPLRPWTLTIDGEVEASQTIAIDDLLRKVALEERVYRHRCVETWAMVVPWTGFTVKSLVALAKPTAAAKYIRFESFNRPEIAAGQKPGFLGNLPWPYVEALTLAEATNELPLMVTGAYGKPLPKAMGAPLRLHVPWKYGFKSIKGITKVSFVKERPKTMWEKIDDTEYGFWANVNPEVSHPRWSQASETMLGTGERRATQLFNGYGAEVAGLYKDLGAEELYM